MRAPGQRPYGTVDYADWPDQFDEDVFALSAAGLSKQPTAIQKAARVIQPPAPPAANSLGLEEEDARRRINSELWMNLGISGGLAAAQAATAIIPTAMDTRNREQLKALKSREATGRLGLEAGERSLLERQMMSPVRALATESRARDEATLAGMGDQSAAAQMRVRSEGQRNVQDAARQAGEAIAQKDLDEKARERMEIEQRTQAKADRQKEVLGSIAGAISQAGAIGGKVMEGRAMQKFDYKALRDAGFSTADIMMMRDDVARSAPWQREDVIAYWTGAEPKQKAAPPAAMRGRRAPATKATPTAPTAQMAPAAVPLLAALMDFTLMEQDRGVQAQAVQPIVPDPRS